MPLAALLFAHHLEGAPSLLEEEPIAATEVAGTSIIERQIRQARRLGAQRIFVLVEHMPPRLALALERARRGRGDVLLVRSALEVRRTLSGELDPVLVVEEGLVVDEAVLEAMAALPVPAIAVWRGAEPQTPPAALAAERLDALTLWGGVALVSADRIRQIGAELGEWDLQSTLFRAVAAEGAAQLDLAGFHFPRRPFAPGAATGTPLFWAKPRRDEAEPTTAALILASRRARDAADWPARALYPPVESFMLRLLLPTRVDATTVALGWIVAGLLAVGCFASGWLWAGLLLALLLGPLEGIEARLAGLRLEPSAFARHERRLRQLIEIGWCGALAHHFAQREGLAGAWALAAVIILFGLARAGEVRLFEFATGQRLEQDGIGGRLARFTGSRDIALSLLALSALSGLWYTGFGLIAVYAAASFFAVQRLLLAELGGRPRAPAPLSTASPEAPVAVGEANLAEMAAGEGRPG